MGLLTSIIIAFTPAPPQGLDETNAEIYQFLMEEIIRLEYKDAEGCPFEPGYYYNLECA